MEPHFNIKSIYAQSHHSQQVSVGKDESGDYLFAVYNDRLV